MATTTIDVNRFNRGLIEALGLKGQLVRRIVLTADCDEFPTVVVTKLVVGPEADRLVEALEAYRLVDESVPVSLPEPKPQGFVTGGEGFNPL